MPDNTSHATTPYTVSQQCLSVIRQLLNAKGWPETLSEAYDGGRLVSKYLPQLDPLDWILSGEKLAKLSEAELAEYQKRDKAWGTKQIELALSDKQVALVKKSFAHFVGELIKAKQLGVNEVFNEIVDVFAIDPSTLDKAGQ